MPVPADQDAIGGYFGLESTAPAAQWPWPDGVLFQSARAGFLALLQLLAPKAVWLPWFICDAMAEPLQRLGVRMRRYALGQDFRIVSPPALGAGEYLLYVNYFGLSDALESELVAAYPTERLIFDHAQALYSPPAGAATLFSPRKFLGVPDGGILVTSHHVPEPDATDVASVSRIRGRLLRSAFGAEAGHADILRAEQSLAGQPPRSMSMLTRRLLAAADHARVRDIRRRNFDILDAALQGHNRLRLPLGPQQVPLCYPFWPEKAIERAEMHRARVYVPTYWPELLDRSSQVPTSERAWAAEWLPLPIDQRYDTGTLQKYVVEPILNCAAR